MNILKVFVANPFLRYGGLIALPVVAVALLFPGFIPGLFRADQFMPHATCYLRNPAIILLHVSSDLLIGLAYVSIALTLAYLVYKGSKDIPFHWMFLAFGLFIVTCGLTHFMEVWTVWQAVYWLAGYVKAVTAVASVATAVALVRLVPGMLALVHSTRVSEERRARLETANQDLEAFAYSVSHDLRAPLRAVQGLGSALAEDYGAQLPAEGREYLNRILDASQRMDVLIRDLLEYSRVSRREVALSPVELRPIIDQTLKSMAADLERTQAEVEVAGDFGRVLGNDTLLGQVLSNLLGNAIKFVPSGTRPRIRVWAETGPRTVRVSVRDNGIGIAQEYQDKVFRLFERLHSPAEYPGTGIGLAIVQKAVARMNGKLGLESVAGAGATFWFELPRSA